MERTLVPSTGIPTYLVPMAPPSSPRGIVLLALATLRSIALLLRTRPRVTVGTGGYACVPAAAASWLLRIPVVLFLPDVVPGKAVRGLIPIARTIAASTEDALAYLPRKKTVVTGYPVRDPFLKADRIAGRRRLGIPEDATVLVVAGGSLGARSLNDAIARCLPSLLESYHVIHVAGTDRYPEVQAATSTLSAAQRARYHLVPYLDAAGMADVLAAADLAVTRAGASTLGELPATGTPAVLVPLPIPGVHQRENAEYLAHHGGAVVLDNDHLSELGDLLAVLLSDRERLTAMASAMSALRRPDAAERIAALAEAAL